MIGLNRHATGLRIIVATLLEAAPIDHEDSVDRRDRLLKSVTALADSLPAAPGSVVGMLGLLIQLVEQTLQEEPDGPLNRCLTSFLDRVSARNGAERCALCAGRLGAEPLCAALDAWPRGSGHLCVDEVASLLFEFERRARAIYAPHAEESAKTAVRFSLIPVANGSVHGFIPEFHLDGATRATDSASSIEIVLEDRALDLLTLRQLAYVCVHELVCHAFQGIRSPGRRDVGASCSWSEGWMDTLAWLLLERWLNEAQSMPPWLVRAPTPRSAIDDCRKLHERRYAGRQGRVMDPENILRRRQARDACEALYRYWSGPSFKRPSEGLRKLIRFSVRINVAVVERAQRETLIVRLVGGLMQSSGPMFDRTILACETFLGDKAKTLAELIEELSAPPGVVYGTRLD